MKHLLLLLTALFISSCGKYEINHEDYLKDSYQYEFVKQFGKIDISHDWGFTKNLTRSVNPNSNEWYNIPDDITELEKEIVKDWFDTHKYPKSESVNWSDYFVQHISGNHNYMDKLIASTEHVNNFNATAGSIQLICNGASDKFGYFNSLDSKEHYEYVIQYINGHCYVGFDFEATGENPNQKEERDGYYNDWIIKITPCLPKLEYGHRVMVEDLGVIGDFDFNDVVFDYYISYNEWWHGNDFCIIILRAAGGTMPLYVGGKEVHEAFGVDTGVMVNTSDRNFQPVIYRTIVVPESIPVLVNNNGLIYEITAETGEAPGKICVPTNVDWTYERQNIKEKYPKFKNWVENKNNLFWK